MRRSRRGLTLIELLIVILIILIVVGLVIGAMIKLYRVVKSLGGQRAAIVMPVMERA